ncbi:MAG: M48 family metalloprotease [Candidatus Eremiobacteraeota bacterium]|nr:M48 family metalloprotease [Candidatus Eremiobacteraeota bacterium]
MDSINTNPGTQNMHAVKRDLKPQSEASTEGTPKETFTKSASTDMPAKPVFKESDTSEKLGLLSSLSPATQAGIAAGVPGSPVFKSIGGTLAKWLISTKEEVKIGEMVADQVESTMSISRNPAMNQRINRIGKQIAANSKRQDLSYQFKVIDDDTVNAFACPGGFIYVHKGLLDRFPKDSHIAFILGHEMAHVENRDSIDKLGTNFMLAILQSSLGKIPGKLDDMLGAAAGMLYDKSISRRAEYKADRRGAEHMMKLGYSPREGADALRGLESAGRKEPGRLEKLLSTHPPTESRAKKLEKFAKSKGY